MKSAEEHIARLEKRIIALDTQIGVLDKKVGDLAGNENRVRNRRRKKEQVAKTLRAKRDAYADRIILLLIKTDPDQQQRLLDLLPDHLKSLTASSLLNRQPMGPGEAPAVGPEVAAASRHQDAPPPPSAPTTDSRRSPADTVPSDAAPGSHDSASAASPAAVDSSNEEPRPSADPGEGGATPSQAGARPDEPHAPAAPQDKPTEKQTKFITALIDQFPDKAAKIGVGLESLPNMSKQRMSWAIKQLAPPRTGKSRTGNRR